MKKFFLLLALALFCFTCSTDSAPQDNLLKTTNKFNAHLAQLLSVTGIKYSESSIATQAAYNRFINELNKIEPISIVAELDHSRNAKSVDLELDLTKIVFFGNPKLGTPLMQKNQLAGLDLPQKVLFFRDGDKNDFAIYNSVAYLSSRHGLEGVSTLNQISNALDNLVSQATKSDLKMSNKQTVGLGEGIITKDSNQNFSETYQTLRTAIATNPNLSIVAELDHQANAQSVNMNLPPTKIIMFGNPNLGTPLMQEQQTVGLDLPQKMLVWQDDNGVHISYNDPYFLASRHNLQNVDAVLETISGALNNLSNEAAGL